MSKTDGFNDEKLYQMVAMASTHRGDLFGILFMALIGGINRENCRETKSKLAKIHFSKILGPKKTNLMVKN